MLLTNALSLQSPQPLANWLTNRLVNELLLAADEEIETTSHAPLAWDVWLRELFPDLFPAPFAPHQIEFWEWVESIVPHESRSPFIGIWARGGAKTTSAEAAVVRLGAKGTRRFCLYVRSVQERANESVRNIAAMLESPSIEHYYPLLAKRRMSKYGFSQGWKADMLRCASGFSVVGLGFDAAVRGVKIEGDRPDLIVFDDLDERSDSQSIVEKKIRILTSSILPAGSRNVVILGIQNLVHQGSIFSKMADGTADFLYDRYISGPHPAVRNLTYTTKPGSGYTITGGEATWEGQDLETCERQINEWGLTAFLQESQHQVEEAGGIWSHIEFQHCTNTPSLVRGCVWVDPAVTSTDDSDCQAIQADGLGVDGKLYRLWSWEAVASPEEALTRAVLKCLELGLDSVGVETDQGGDTWRSVYAQVWGRIVEAHKWFLKLSDSPDDKEANAFADAHPDLAAVAALPPTQRLTQPAFKSAKAGEGHGSKVARNQRMLVSYEQGRVVHVIGTHGALERSLKRFPNKPLDLADAAYWCWWDLMDSRVHSGSVGRVSDRRPSTVTPPTTQQYLLLHYMGDRAFPLTIGNQTYMIDRGWERRIESETARQIAQQFPSHFEVTE